MGEGRAGVVRGREREGVEGEDEGGVRGWIVRSTAVPPACREKRRGEGRRSKREGEKGRKR